MDAGWRDCCLDSASPGLSTSPAAPRGVRNRGRAILCWSVPRVATASCATEPPRVAPRTVFPFPILPRIPVKSSMRTEAASMTELRSYIRDGGEIYRNSFAIIRAEANLSRFKQNEEKLAVRIIHACGMVDIADDLLMSPTFAARASEALLRGAPVLCDAKMVAHGITRSRLPRNNSVVCTLDDPAVAPLAAEIGNTRSAAALELWRPHLEGAVVAIGNAPTSLFRLLEMLDKGAPLPAAIIGVPVGFVGAAESKQALAAQSRVPFLVVSGRRGGSAMAAAAVNALASERE